MKHRSKIINIDMKSKEFPNRKDFPRKEFPKEEIIVFTDGSCSNQNKKPVGGIGIHFPYKELKDISKVYDKGYCTNQKAELLAILTALKYIKKNLGLRKYHILIKTDSEYSINSITKWIYQWMDNGWKTKNGAPVSNREFIEKIFYYYNKYDIEFVHVNGHSKENDPDSVGNNRADYLATKATRKALKEKKSESKWKQHGSKFYPRSEFVRHHGSSKRRKKYYSDADIQVELIK
jgi:ribonuclease HI